MFTPAVSPWVLPNLLQSFKIVPVPRNHHRASGVWCEHDILTKSSAEILRRNLPTDSHFFNHLTSPPRSWSRCKQMCRFLGIYEVTQWCPTLSDPTRLPRPWDSPGKNTGVGCHFLLQCMKVKSESEVAQWCPTLSDPMDCSPPGSSVHGICQARATETT